MLRLPTRIFTLLFLLTMVSISTAPAAQRAVVSTMKNVSAVTESRGYFLAPAFEKAGQVIQGDEAATQAFEVIRPSDSRVTIGRLFTSCSCVQLESTKTSFERGERALLTLRNVKPTPPNGQNYAIYVQLTSPVRTTLRYDTFVQSDRFVVQQTPTVVNAVETVEYVKSSYMAVDKEDSPSSAGMDITPDVAFEVMLEEVQKPMSDQETQSLKSEEASPDTVGQEG